jgi:hypothetical protein
MVIVWILTACVGLFLLVLLIGTFLPERYDSDLRARFAATPDEVWEAAQDVRRHPHAGKQCRQVTDVREDTEQRGWVEDLGSSQIAYETLEAQRPTRLVRRARDKQINVTFHVTLTLEADGEGALVRSRTETNVRKGSWHIPVFRVLLKLSDGANRANRDWLKRLGASLDAAPQFD